jgi:nucleoside-diphosphate-sugar epimerase
VEGDLQRLEESGPALERSAPEVVIHTAWHAEPGTYLTDPGNVADLQVSLELFQRARDWGCQRIVGVGTCLEYDMGRGWLDEAAPLGPRSLYASAKAALYLVGTNWARDNHVSFAWARLFFQYGPGEDRRRLVAMIITSLLAGTPVATTSGEQLRDYLHVDDVAAAIIEIALSQLEGAVNVGSGKPIRIKDLVRCIEQQIGVEGMVDIGGRADRPDEAPFICANTARIRNELDWRPTIQLDRGIAETVAWWRTAGVTAPQA